MSPILDLLVPAVLLLLMLVVGLSLTGDDFQRLRVRSTAFALATLAQMVLLPLLAAGLVWCFDPLPPIAAGLVILAACPGGALSNYYCHLARGDVAFSVVLTAVASLMSLVTLPVAAHLGFFLLGQSDIQVSVPVVRILLQLLFFVLLPIALGMATRALWPNGSVRWLPTLNRVCTTALVGLLGAVFVDQIDSLDSGAFTVVALAVAFTGLSLVLGASLGWVLRLEGAAISALALEFSVRNLGIMALVAVTVFGRLDYLLFGAIFLVVQFPVALSVTSLVRRIAQGNKSKNALFSKG